jgi:Tol biopolymer transport system component
MLPNISSAVQNGVSATDIGARISANGRYAAFSSNQSLVSADTSLNDGDIYLYDLQLKQLKLASTNSDGTTLAGVKLSASLSADGSMLSFQNTVNGNANIMVKNMTTGALSTASTTSTGAAANGQSYNAVLSGDAHYVAFISKATNLVAGDTNGRDDVFVKDLLTGAVVNASTTAAGVQADAPSGDTAISADGRTVVFTTFATNLAAGDDSYADIYAKNLNTGALTRVSTDSNGVGANGSSDNAAVSGDGRYVVFTSQADNLVWRDTNGVRDVFRKDLLTGETVRVSVSTEGQQGLGESSNASISNNGRYVLFESKSNFTAGDGDGRADIFIKDLETGALTRLSSGGDANHYNYASNAALASGSLDAVFVHYQMVANTTADERTITHTKVGAGFGSLTGETINGGAGVDVITANQGRDRITGLGGDDIIDGGGGVDTAVYAGNRDAYTVAITTSGTLVTSVAAGDGKDALANVERLHFANADVALDINGHAGQAYRLYQAAFDRAPDLPGLGFWINARDSGVTMESIAHDFLVSDEGKSLYGVNPSNAEVLTRFYANTLHRAPDPAGYAFWLDALNNNIVSQASVLAQFSDSPENQAQVIGAIQNGINYTPYG